jgi:hypothetical protein
MAMNKRKRGERFFLFGNTENTEKREIGRKSLFLSSRPFSFPSLGNVNWLIMKPQ